MGDFTSIIIDKGYVPLFYVTCLNAYINRYNILTGICVYVRLSEGRPNNICLYVAYN